MGVYGRESSVKNLLSASHAFGLSTEAAATRILTLAEEMTAWKDCFSQSGVNASDLAILSSTIEPKLNEVFKALK